MAIPFQIDPDSLSNDEDGGDYNVDGERIRNKKTDGGPWNKLVGGQKTEEQDRSEASTPGEFETRVVL